MSKPKKKKFEMKITWVEDMTISKEEKQRRIDSMYDILFTEVMKKREEKNKGMDETQKKLSRLKLRLFVWLSHRCIFHVFFCHYNKVYVFGRE